MTSDHGGQYVAANKILRFIPQSSAHHTKTLVGTIVTLEEVGKKSYNDVVVTCA